MTIKIGITGCKGRVGSLLTAELQSGSYPALELAGGTDLKMKQADKTANFFITENPNELFERADVIIDFTTPEATRKHMWLAAKSKTPLIIGTTGLDVGDEAELKDTAQETAIVYTANMSVGVNILLSLIEQAAAKLEPENWDIEIFESHHKYKVDAPSGTALAMGKAAASGRGIELNDKAIYSREGQTGTRKDGDIGFSVARGGDVVGEHTAYFYAQGERLELSHIATDRSLFAKGALKAATWASSQKPGLYNMKDVLGL